MTWTQILLALALGIGLAAAAGLRVFLPLLVLAVAAHFGVVPLASSFEWLAGTPAIAMLAIAAVAELAAYYIPGLDHLLDTVAAPLALMAGTLMVAAPLAQLPPWVQWSAAVVAGGGAAGMMQGLTSLLRAKSTLTTGGLGNPVVATGEWGGALLLSLLAIVMPLLAVAVALVVVVGLYRLLRRLLRRA
ncbi:MAG: DUF4126 domain-containing protein [Steroidobacteraceae bacterium]